VVCKTLENQILSNNKNRGELKYSGKVCSSSPLMAPLMVLSIEIQWPVLLGEKIIKKHQVRTWDLSMTNGTYPWSCGTNGTYPWWYDTNGTYPW